MHLVASLNVKFNARLYRFMSYANRALFFLLPTSWNQPALSADSSDCFAADGCTAKAAEIYSWLIRPFQWTALYALLLFACIVNDSPVGIFSERWKTGLKETHDSVAHGEVISCKDWCEWVASQMGLPKDLIPYWQVEFDTGHFSKPVWKHFTAWRHSSLKVLCSTHLQHPQLKKLAVFHWVWHQNFWKKPTFNELKGRLRC